MPRKGKHHPGHHEKHKKEEKEAEEDPELEEAPSGKPPSWIVRVFHRDLHGGYKRRNAVAIMSMAIATVLLDFALGIYLAMAGNYAPGLTVYVYVTAALLVILEATYIGLCYAAVRLQWIKWAVDLGRILPGFYFASLGACIVFFVGLFSLTDVEMTPKIAGIVLVVLANLCGGAFSTMANMHRFLEARWNKKDAQEAAEAENFLDKEIKDDDGPMTEHIEDRNADKHNRRHGHHKGHN